MWREILLNSDDGRRRGEKKGRLLDTYPKPEEFKQKKGRGGARVQLQFLLLSDDLSPYKISLLHTCHSWRDKQQRRIMSSHMLEIEPEQELKFTLSHNEATPRCILTLKHPGRSDSHLAFKVRDFHVELWYILHVGTF